LTGVVDWAEKYRPKSLSEVAGNPTAIRDLRRWADSWEHHPEKRAVVLSGPPGCGKTSAALALAADLGWTPVEMNASDARNATAVREVATRGATLQTFTATGEFVTARGGGRKLIILDEADHLFGNQDRGGVAQIVETVREARQPIVLIVNDYYALTRRSSSLRTLARQIKFQRLRNDAVAAALRRIYSAEGIEASDEVLRRIGERAQGDLRSAVNDLQTVAMGRKRVGEEDLAVLGARDREVEVFTAMREIFESGDAARARAATENLDQSPEDLILWIDENLPIAYRDPKDLAEGFRALSRADIFLGRVPRRQHYRLWAFASDLMTAGVAVARRGRWAGGQYRFPLWLAKMGRFRGTRATRGSLGAKVGRHVHLGSRGFLVEMLPAVRELFAQDPEFRVALTAACALDEKEVAFLLGEAEDSEAVKRVSAEAAKLAAHPEVRPRFMEEFEGDGG